MSDDIKRHKGRIINNQTIIEYHITGVDRYNKRFSLVYTNKFIAMGINLYRGSVWEVINGKRKLLKRV